MAKRLTQEEKEQRELLKQQEAQLKKDQREAAKVFKKEQLEQEKKQAKLLKKKEKTLARKSHKDETDDIKKFIEKVIFTGGIIWAKEMSIAYKILKDYPIKFLLTLTKGAPSLAWFLTEKGKSYLVTEFSKYNYQSEAFNCDFIETVEKAPQEIKPKPFTLKDLK
jgi:hypothetical protein